MVAGPDATLGAITSATGDARYQVVNLHGDVATALDSTLIPRIRRRIQIPPGGNGTNSFTA